MKPFMRKKFEQISELVEYLWHCNGIRAILNSSNMPPLHEVLPQALFQSLNLEYREYLEMNMISFIHCKNRQETFKLVISDRMYNE